MVWVLKTMLKYPSGRTRDEPRNIWSYTHSQDGLNFPSEQWYIWALKTEYTDEHWTICTARIREHSVFPYVWTTNSSIEIPFYSCILCVFEPHLGFPSSYQVHLHCQPTWHFIFTMGREDFHSLFIDTR